MKYTVTKSVVWVVGKIWLPPITAAYHYELSDYDLENIAAWMSLRENEGKTWRDGVEDWLTKNAGDFQEIIDFYASLEPASGNVEIPWADEGNEVIYNDCVFGSEDE